MPPECARSGEVLSRRLGQSATLCCQEITAATSKNSNDVGGVAGKSHTVHSITSLCK